MAEYCYLIHLLRCGINGDIPRELPEGMSFSKVYHYAMEHDVANLAFYAVDRLEYKPEPRLYDTWKLRCDLALARDMNQAFARQEIVDAFHGAGIRFKELQGTVLKNLYPATEYRTMSDLDFIVEKSRLRECGQILSDLGYRCQYFKDHDIIAQRDPLIVVEIHTDYFPEDSEYYNTMGHAFDVERESDGDSFNELYLYNILHIAKHYFCGGCGIRRVLDMYLLDKHYGTEICRESIDSCLEKAGLLSFARDFSILAQQWFGDDPCFKPTDHMGHYVMGSGLHGNRSNFIHSRLLKIEDDRSFKTGTKVRYLLTKLFPGDHIMVDRYPVLQKARILYPILWIHRILKMLIGGKNRKKSFLDLRLILKAKYDER